MFIYREREIERERERYQTLAPTGEVKHVCIVPWLRRALRLLRRNAPSNSFGFIFAFIFVPPHTCAHVTTALIFV